ncbi:MAG TPA: hypothetical protein VK978_01075, partial [Candidatus Saccharimonadales bacterium]|nr:hypothetical protein [Candidatus Saccharimonadales bacterium]
KRRKVVAAAAGLLALAGTGFLMYNGMYGGGSGGAREQAADALSSGKGGAGVDAAPPAPADVPPALADVPPAPAEVPPALVEVPEYARQSLERSGDTIWRDAADILRQQGIEDPSDGQIAEAKNRILAHIGKTEAEAASLPVGFQYEVPDLSDMFGPADAPAPDTPLQTQATHTELAAADTTHVHVASPTDTIAHSAVMSPPEVIDQYERLSQENRSGLSAYAGSLAMAKLTFDPVIEQVQQYYADEADHRTKKKAKKKKTAA